MTNKTMTAVKFLTSQLILNWLARILFFTCLAALLPMSQYIENIGGNKSEIGVVMSAFACGVLLFRPLVGNKVDSLGRKAVLLLGIVVFIVAPLIYIAVHTVNMLILVRIFHGFGLAAFGTASITLITDAAPQQHRGAVISYTGMVNTIAFAIGPALGFFIFEKWGYNALFTVSSVMALACFVLSLFIVETKTRSHTDKQVKYFHVIKQRRILVAASIFLIVGLVHGGVMFFIPIFLKNIKINTGLFYTTYGVAAFLVRLVIGPLSDRIGRGPVLLCALTLLSAGLFLLSQSTSAALMLTSAAIYGLGFGSNQPSLTTLVADNTTEETRGKIFSFFYGGFDLGISVAGVALGVIAEHFGIKIMFVVCGTITIAGLVIFVMMMEESVAASLRCAFTIGRNGTECYTCNQYMEVAPKQAESYFKSN